MSEPILHTPNVDPEIMLEEASNVTSFLRAVAPALYGDNARVYLNEDGAHGLSLILDALENTIKQAIEKL